MFAARSVARSSRAALSVRLPQPCPPPHHVRRSSSVLFSHLLFLLLCLSLSLPSPLALPQPMSLRATSGSAKEGGVAVDKSFRCVVSRLFSPPRLRSRWITDALSPPPSIRRLSLSLLLSAIRPLSSAVCLPLPHLPFCLSPTISQREKSQEDFYIRQRERVRRHSPSGSGSVVLTAVARTLHRPFTLNRSCSRRARPRPRLSSRPPSGTMCVVSSPTAVCWVAIAR